MPVKWTPDNDQMLLLKILETHSDLSVDAKKISSAWPSDRDAPTARAITERLVKIRSLAKANGAGHFNIASSQRQTKSQDQKASGPVTPRKRRAGVSDGVIGSGSGSGSGSKRKRTPASTKNPSPAEISNEISNDDDDDDEENGGLGKSVKVSAAEEAWLQHGDVSAAAYPTPTHENSTTGPYRSYHAETESPSKKARKGRAGVVKVERYASASASASVGEGESSGSEFDADAV
ncbi:MAG: hypothetical protein M1830_008062 [Pleopsidium flavum]|nr:MAG: hypothetical protein M1830_008062 [Pleopsidium flavum]